MNEAALLVDASNAQAALHSISVTELCLLLERGKSLPLRFGDDATAVGSLSTLSTWWQHHSSLDQTMPATLQMLPRLFWL